MPEETAERPPEETAPPPSADAVRARITAHEEACLAALQPVLEAYGCELYAAPMAVGDLYLLRVGVRLAR